MQLKRCPRCEETKGVSSFSKNKTMKDGMQSQCKSCKKEIHMEHVAKDPVRHQEKTKAYGAKWWASLTPEKRKAYKLKHNYDLTIEEYNVMLKEQNNLCLICKEILIKPVVDHCHTTGKVRGLLCGTCNSGIGMLKDDPEIVLRAYDYLKECS